jgi:hypothetical protein
VDWTVRDVRQSPAGVHVQLTETVNGVPIAGADSTVTIRHGAAAPRFTIDRQVPGRGTPSAQPTISRATAERAAVGAIDQFPDLRGTVDSRLVYLPDGSRLKLAWEVRVPAMRPLGDFVIAVDASNGNVLGTSNAMAFDSGQVFVSNPFEQSAGTVPPPFDCDSLANATALSSYRSSVTLRGIDDGQHKLKGEYVDLTAPGILGAYKLAGQADEPSRVYAYACNDDRFEEVMVYHHVDTTQRLLQSLGFVGSAGILNDAPVSAHAHYYSACNAFYSPFDEGLHFGDGNALEACLPDAAEDGDIAIHEYGHAIHDDVVPGWGLNSNALLTEQARSMGEGFSDYLAATVRGDPCIAGWGLFAGVCLRDITEVMVYPTDFEACPDLPNGAEEEHCGGKIWSGVLWQLSEELGGDDAARKTVLRLVLASHFYLAPLPTFSESLGAILAADQDLYGGVNSATIESVFAAQGINANTIDDFAYYFFRIRHPQNSNLEIRIKVGADPNAPICQDVIWDNNLSFGGDLYGYVKMPESGCAAFFPPAPAVPWHLEVLDTVGPQQGTLTDFQVAFANSPVRCLSDDPPVAISGMATIDCTLQTSAAEFDSDADTVPNLTDNCALVPNVDQINTDAVLPGGDIFGDACDLDDDNDALRDPDELSASACGAFDLSATAHPAPGGGDVTNDDDEDGIAAPPMGTDLDDDGVSWDTDGDGVLDGYECAHGSDPRDPASVPGALADDLADDDGDGLANGWERRGWGTDEAVADTNSDGAGDCKSALDVNDDGVVNFAGDTIKVARAAVLNDGRSWRADIDKNGVVNFPGDAVSHARRALGQVTCL